MKYSAWQKIGTIPKKPGVYQVNYEINKCYSFQYWNGKEWEFICDSPEKCFDNPDKSLFQKPIWRSFPISLAELYAIQKLLFNQITVYINNDEINWGATMELVEKFVVINRSILLNEFEELYGVK